jgi:alkylated DNA repair protein alkB family protein 1
MTTSHLPDPQPSSSHTPFRQAEKHFKSRLIPHTTPSLPLDIIDLSRPVSQEEDEIWRSGWWGPVEDEGTVRWRRRKGKERERGERPFERGGERLEKLVLGDGTVGYLVADGQSLRCSSLMMLIYKGCVLIPNYLDGQEQLKLLQRALGRYTLPPNPLSLSTHYDLPQNLFHTYTTSPQTLVPTLFSKLPLAGQESIRKREQEIGHRTTKDTPAGSEVGYEKILTAGRDWEGDVPGSKLSERSVGELMKELRWANLGWVYRVCRVNPVVRRAIAMKED